MTAISTRLLERLQQHYQDWKSHLKSDHSFAISFFLIIHALKYDLKKRQAQLLEDDLNHEGLLLKWQFKKVKGKALESLKSWGQDQYDFILLDTMPTTREVLAYQAQGKRPVSILMEDLFSPKRHKSDSFEFFCHDLEHGAMFFQDVDLFRQQKAFFTNIERSLLTDLWTPYWEQQGFMEKWAYLVSDMNTHPEHYKAYLQAMIPAQEHQQFDFLFEF